MARCIRISEWGRYYSLKEIPLTQELVDKFNSDTREYYPDWKDLSMEEFEEGIYQNLEGKFDDCSLNEFVRDWIWDKSYELKESMLDLDSDGGDFSIE